MEEAGGRPKLIAPDSDKKVQAFNHLDKADTFAVDTSTTEAKPAEFDGMVLPGGVANPDQLRINKPAVQFIKGMVEANKPVAVICQGPWTLVEAGVLKGRTITSWPSIQADIRNAGGTWVDEQVHVDNGPVSSRKPDDLPAFCKEMIEEFAEGEHRRSR